MKRTVKLVVTKKRKLNKLYPITKFGELIYVRYPIKNEYGKWVTVDVLSNGYRQLYSPVQFKSEKECEKACDVRNKFYGWTKDEADRIISDSMERSKPLLSEAFFKRHCTMSLVGKSGMLDKHVKVYGEIIRMEGIIINRHNFPFSQEINSLKKIASDFGIGDYRLNIAKI